MKLSARSIAACLALAPLATAQDAAPPPAGLDVSSGLGSPDVASGLGSLDVSSGLGSLGGPADFPELTNADIPGAPLLGTPQLVMGATGPVVGRQHGLAAPSVRDWDGDGVKDLLIGEFETGECWVRVYRNVGTNAEPAFTDEFVYAQSTDGARIHVESW